MKVDFDRLVFCNSKPLPKGRVESVLIIGQTGINNNLIPESRPLTLYNAVDKC